MGVQGMRVRHYTAASLAEELGGFEAKYGLSSAELYEAYRIDAIPVGVSHFDAFVWADTYEEWRRLCAAATSE